MADSIKLIAVDLDGTLLDGQKQACRAGADALKRAEMSGVHIVVATARNAESTGWVVGHLDFKGPVITSTGAMILDRMNGEIWESHHVPQHIAQDIAAFADARKWGLAMLVNGVTNYSWDRATENQFMGAERNTRVSVESGVAGVTGDVTQMVVRDISVIPEMQAYCHEHHSDLIRCQPFYHADGSLEAIAILPKLANKGDALQSVMEKLGVRAAEVLALGDNDSDIPMFETAGVSACMDNGTGRARGAAHHIAPHHDEEGVAWAINNLVFGEGIERG